MHNYNDDTTNNNTTTLTPMILTFENQFDKELNDSIPDPKKEYYINSNTKDKGLTLLMKSIIIYNKYPDLFNNFLTISGYIKNQINDYTTDFKCTALMILCKSSRLLNAEKLIKILLYNGAVIDNTTIHGSTALMFASYNSNSTSTENTVEILLNNGANVNTQSINGHTALMFAAENTNNTSTENTVKILINNGANVNIQNIKGHTALMFAAENTNSTSTENTVEILLNNGANVNTQSINGHTALTLSFVNNNNISKILIENGATFTEGGLNNTMQINLYKFIIEVLRNQLEDKNNRIKEITKIRSVMTEQEVINTHVLQYI